MNYFNIQTFKKQIMLKFLFINKRGNLCALYYFGLTTKKMKFYNDNKTIFRKPTHNLKIKQTQLI